MCRQLNDALCLMREARKVITGSEPDPVASRVECGDKDFASHLTTGDCQTCALLERISATEDDDDRRTIICSECRGEEFANQAIRGECRACAHYNALANAF